MRLGLLVGLVGLSWPSWAYAHSESAAPVFVNGLIHPTLNATHLLALVAVGVFAGTSGGRARWAYPASSLGATALGGTFGFTWPHADPMTVASALFLGLLAWSLVSRTEIVVACSALIVLGAAHGYAHGVGMQGHGGWEFGAGLLLTMGLLQATGLLLGFALGPLRTTGNAAVATVTCLLGLYVLLG